MVMAKCSGSGLATSADFRFWKVRILSVEQRPSESLGRLW